MRVISVLRCACRLDIFPTLAETGLSSTRRSGGGGGGGGIHIKVVFVVCDRLEFDCTRLLKRKGLRADTAFKCLKARMGTRGCGTYG